MKTGKFVYILKAKQDLSLWGEITDTKVWKKALLSTQALGIICAMTGPHAFRGFYRRWTLFEEFDKGSRGKLLQPGAAYMLSKHSVWHFETKYKNQQ